MGFSTQEYWSELPYPSPGNLPEPGMESKSPALQANSLPSEPPQFSSVAQSCLTLCNPMDCNTPGFPVLKHLLKHARSHVHWVGGAIHHLVLYYPLLPPSISSSIRVFSNELAPCIRWPKYWSFSFNISPSNEYSGLISFRIVWLDLPCNPRDSQ